MVSRSLAHLCGISPRTRALLSMESVKIECDVAGIFLVRLAARGIKCPSVSNLVLGCCIVTGSVLTLQVLLSARNALVRELTRRTTSTVGSRLALSAGCAGKQLKYVGSVFYIFS